jgi:serine/threonine protein kinase
MSMVGKTLAHYEITSQLGKGGMGEVYQAKDRKLGRDVAIKVLPEEFARDTDRVARFQREAKLLASLNHPNIAAIHGLEESEGTNFLVLELVEGQTLAERIAGTPGRAPEKIAEILKLALQIAEALEAAHEKGVIHRDLKPANIKVTPEGKAKVLDFGLAKAFAGEQADLNLSNSPTLSNAATQQGVILGTAAYMSPEQARGETVDKKADIWAFGCVLFEMLTGRATFEGRTVSDVLASVIKSEPAWSRLPPNLHPRIRLLLERCLEKEAKNRCSGIGDARADIQKALADPGGVLAPPVPQSRPRTLLAWVAVAVVLAAIITGAAVWKLRKSEPPQVTRLYFELPKDQQLSISMAGSEIAVSPDGRQIVYAANGGLYLRSMDELEARLIPGIAENPLQPFFSPDGKWIGYRSGGFAGGQLKKIAISGGTPVTLTEASPLGRISWGEDGTIVYGDRVKGIMRVSANGGIPEVLVKAEEGRIYICPQILPGGKAVLFTFATGPYKVMVQSLRSGERKELFGGDTARYLPTGHIVYALENNIFAIPFNPAKLEVEGEPIRMVEGVFRLLAPVYAVSDSGTLVYVSQPAGFVSMPGRGGRGGMGMLGRGGRGGGTSVQNTLVWVDRNGKEEPLGTLPNYYGSPRISPDGTKVALTVTANEAINIWIWDLVRKNLTPLTFVKLAAQSPLWTLDSKRIAYGTVGETRNNVYWKAADGTGKDELLHSSPTQVMPPFPWTWSRDGKILIMASMETVQETGIGTSRPDRSIDIGALSMEGDRKWKLLLKEKYSELQPQVSPDGRWMAYTSNESGKNEIYVRPFPDVEGGRQKVSTDGGDSALWSRNGRELFYRNGDAVMTVLVQTEPTFSLGIPRILFRRTYASEGNPLFNRWDVSPDGKRFLMIKAVQPAETPGEKPPAAEAPQWRINIVLNWHEELKQRVPVK